MKINKVHVIQMLIYFVYLKLFESGILVSGITTLSEDIDGCANQYIYDLAIYLMNFLSSSFVIIMDCAIIAPGHIKDVVYVLNEIDNLYL